MTIDEILLLPTDQQIEKLKVVQDLPDYESELKPQYNPEEHEVFSTTIRPMKLVTRSTGSVDSSGRDITEQVYEDVNRIAVPFQRIIVNRTVGFLLGNPVTIKSYAEDQQQELLTEMVKKTLVDNKEEYTNRKLARMVMSECQSAELWYLTEDNLFWKNTVKNVNSIFKLRCKLLSPSLGDSLYPYFDDYGDMTAFSRGYTLKDNDGKDVEHFDTWTQYQIIQRQKSSGGAWEEVKAPNQFQKIPVIYYSQAEPEWAEVQSMIERYETKLSNFADTNDYFGSPMVKLTGNVLSLPGKTTQGKVIQLDTGGDAEYMAWNQAPESEKLEFEVLKNLIFSMTQTPNISFEEMKAIGSNLSGFAIQLMFTDAHLKTTNKIELFGEMFQRRLNLIKHICGTIINSSLSNVVDTLQLEPIFSPYLPRNKKEEIETLSIARGNKELISKQTALENNPMVGNIEEEMQRMEQDTAKETELQQQELTGTFNL
jgi:SPP1 family phage portal protein